MEKVAFTVSQEINNFIVAVLRVLGTRENPAIVAAISQLYKIVS